MSLNLQSPLDIDGFPVNEFIPLFRDIVSAASLPAMPIVRQIYDLDTEHAKGLVDFAIESAQQRIGHAVYIACYTPQFRPYLLAFASNPGDFARWFEGLLIEFHKRSLFDKLGVQ